MIIGRNLVVPPGIRPLKMPARRGIRTQKWSNPPLCPVGGRWGMTLTGTLAWGAACIIVVFTLHVHNWPRL